jgi:hypothetical protein
LWDLGGGFSDPFCHVLLYAWITAGLQTRHRLLVNGTKMFRGVVKDTTESFQNASPGTYSS